MYIHIRYIIFGSDSGLRETVIENRHGDKSWARLLAFHIALIPLGNGMNPIILPPAMGHYIPYFQHLFLYICGGNLKKTFDPDCFPTVKITADHLENPVSAKTVRRELHIVGFHGRDAIRKPY